MLIRNKRKGSISSKSRARTNAESTGTSHHPRFPTKGVKNRNVLPEPVEIDNYLEEDLIIGLGNDFYNTAVSLKIYNLHLDIGNLYLNLLPFYYTCLGFFFSIIILFDIKFLNLWFFYYYNVISFKFKNFNSYKLDLGLINFNTFKFTLVTYIVSTFPQRMWFQIR